MNELKPFFSYDLQNGEFLLHATEEEARTEAQGSIEYYRDEATDDGWPDDMTGTIGYGKLIQEVVTTNELKKSDYTEEEWEDMGGKRW